MISPELTEAPPESARVAVYPMRTQRNALRVAYAVAPDAFAVAALADALAATVADGVGLALLLERAAVGGSAESAGTLDGESGEDGAGAAVLTAVSGHSRSSK